MPSLDATEYSRRKRVVHGWWHDETLTREEHMHIQRYLEGSTDKPPPRWVQIDRVMS